MKKSSDKDFLQDCISICRTQINKLKKTDILTVNIIGISCTSTHDVLNTVYLRRFKRILAAVKEEFRFKKAIH